MTKNNFIAELLNQVSDQKRSLFVERIKHKEFSKGESVFDQGDNVMDLYIIRKGLIKLCYITSEGKELIKSFISENKIFGSLISSLGQGTSSFSAVCIENVQIDRIAYEHVEELIFAHPRGQQIALEFFRQFALKKEIREYEFLCLSATERYNSFLDQYPDIAQRITQQDLARYLGITPIGLSRLKRKLTTKDR